MNSDQFHVPAVHFGRYAHRPIHALIDVLERRGSAARVPDGIVFGALVHVVRADEGVYVCADLPPQVNVRR